MQSLIHIQNCNNSFTKDSQKSSGYKDCSEIPGMSVCMYTSIKKNISEQIFTNHEPQKPISRPRNTQFVKIMLKSLT